MSHFVLPDRFRTSLRKSKELLAECHTFIPITIIQYIFWQKKKRKHCSKATTKASISVSATLPAIYKKACFQAGKSRHGMAAMLFRTARSSFVMLLTFFKKFLRQWL